MNVVNTSPHQSNIENPIYLLLLFELLFLSLTFNSMHSNSAKPTIPTIELTSFHTYTHTYISFIQKQHFRFEPQSRSRGGGGEMTDTVPSSFTAQ